ncbi:MAG: 4Fe-4S dicluster domain-containing protein [Planctomycetes bacterium]|nr:4Fe-4S dicluster domain-containing protein [Planctomycetota bacterium]
MTIAVHDYFRSRRNDRKKEPRYLAVIDKDACTSCGACATVCPVDCIFEVPSGMPSESYHQVDTSRCIGCQLCYRSPRDSTRFFTLRVCPWDAIDLLHNPAVDWSGSSSSLRNLWLSTDVERLPWAALEEYGYALLLSGEVFVPAERAALAEFLTRPCWRLPDGAAGPLAEGADGWGTYQVFRATSAGRAALQSVFKSSNRVFLG